MNQPTPEWSEEMQRIWNRAMRLARTRGAYGCAFPMPGTSYPPPLTGTMLHDLCFAATASEEAYEAHLTAVREDMQAWKARVKDRAPRKPSIDLSQVEFKI